MNKTIKTKWLKALRSGDYKQGSGMLKCKDNGDYEYCCLGVLGDIVPEFSWALDGNVDILMYGKQRLGFGFLHEQGRQHVGMTTKQEVHVAEMNDNEDHTFNTIADYIEANL